MKDQGQASGCFGERHPALMFVAVVCSAVVAAVILLSQAEGPVVLYQAF